MKLEKITKFNELSEFDVTDLKALYLILNYQRYLNGKFYSSVKNRSAVRGGGRKPFKQKGTGRARQGTSRSPLKPGGGVIFGPQFRSREINLNKTYIRNGIISLLKSKLDSFYTLSSPTDLIKSKELNSILNDSSQQSVLLIVSLNDYNLSRAANNLSNINVNLVSNINVQLLNDAAKVVFTDTAFNQLKDQLK